MDVHRRIGEFVPTLANVCMKLHGVLADQLACEVAVPLFKRFNNMHVVING